MGWLATTCWGATTHGKDRKRWNEQLSRSQQAKEQQQQESASGSGRGAATPQPSSSSSPTDQPEKRSQSAMGAGSAANRPQQLPSIDSPSTPKRGGGGDVPSQQLSPILKHGSHSTATSRPTTSMNMSASALGQGTTGKHMTDASRTSATNSPTRAAKTLPPPSMIVWANERHYSSCLKPESERPKYFVADNGPYARSDTRGEMQRVQCLELCAEKRQVDYAEEQAAKAAKAQRQLDVRFGGIQRRADDHTSLMGENLKRHDDAQAEKRAALEKVIWRKNRRNLPAIERCDGEDEENALRAASFLTIIRAAQRFSQFFLKVQQHKMLGVLRKLFYPLLVLRVAKRKRLAKSYASAFKKLQRNPRPSELDLLRNIADLQTWPVSLAQLFQVRIRPLYVPRGKALCYEGEPVSFVFILMSGKLTATQSLNRFKASTGGGGGAFDDHHGGDGRRNSAGRGRGAGGAMRMLKGRAGGAGGASSSSSPSSSKIISLGEKTTPFVLSEELMSIKNELNVSAFAQEDATIYGMAGGDDGANGQKKADGGATNAGTNNNPPEGDDPFANIPLNRAAHRKQLSRDFKALQAAEDAKIAHLQKSVYASACGNGSGGGGSGHGASSAHASPEDDLELQTVSSKRACRRVINGAVDALPFPLVLPDFKGGPQRKLKATLEKRPLAVSCFHGRHTTTLRGSHATNGCYGWMITADQLSELIRDSAEIDEAGLGEASGDAEMSGLRRMKSHHDVLMATSSRGNFSTAVGEGEGGHGGPGKGDGDGHQQTITAIEGVGGGAVPTEEDAFRPPAAEGDASAEQVPPPAAELPPPPPAAPIPTPAVAEEEPPKRVTSPPRRAGPKGIAGLLGATRAVATRGTAMDRVSHHQLRENRIFELLEPHEAQSLIPMSTVQTFIRGQCIYKYNDHENDIYVVAKGVVEVKQRVANPYHPQHAAWLQMRGLAPDGRPLYTYQHSGGHHGSSGSGGGGGSRGRSGNTSNTMAGSPSRALMNSSAAAASLSGGDDGASSERAIVDTRFVNVGYCFGDEDAIFSQWRTETAVAATDCVLLRFKAYDVISALTPKTVRYQQLKTLYNTEAARKYGIPPTPQVLNALLVKGDGFASLVETSIGKYGLPTTTATTRKQQQQQQMERLLLSQSTSGENTPTILSPKRNDDGDSAFGPVVGATVAVVGGTSGGSPTSALSAPSNFIPNTNQHTNYIWPFPFLVGGGKKVDEPTSAELLAELLSGKGAQAPGASMAARSGGGGGGRANGGSAFNLGGLDLKHTNLMMQHYVTVTLARASLAHLCAVINADSLRTLVFKHSAVVLDSMGTLGVMDTPAAAEAARLGSSAGGLAAGGKTTAKSKRATTEKSAPLSSKPKAGAGKSSMTGSAGGGPSSVVAQFPSLFSNFFFNTMRCSVISPGGVLPSNTSMIWLQRGIVEISTDSVAMGPDGRMISGGGAFGSGGGAFGKFGAVRTDTVTVAAPALIISGAAFKHAKEQFVKCLLSGSIDLTADHYKGPAGYAYGGGGDGAGKNASSSASPTASSSSSRDNGLPTETMVTKNMLIDDALKSGLLQDPDGAIAASIELSASAVKPSAAQLHRKAVMDVISGKSGGSAADKGGGNADNRSGKPPSNANKDSSSGKDGAKGDAGKGGGGAANANSNGEVVVNVTARLQHAPAIVFKYAVSHAAAQDLHSVQNELMGGAGGGGAASASSTAGGVGGEGDHLSSAIGGGGPSSASGSSPPITITARQLEQYRQFEMFNEGVSELSQLAEELGKLSGTQRIVAKSRVMCWHVYYIDAIRRFNRFNPVDVLKSCAAASANAAAASAALNNPAMTSYNHLPLETVEFFPEQSLGAESELQTLVDKSGVYVLR